MLLALLIVLPAFTGWLAFWWRSDVSRRAMLLLTAVAHLGMTIALWTVDLTALQLMGGWIALDDIGLLFLTIASVVFLASALYSVGDLVQLARQRQLELRSFIFHNEPEAVYTGCMLLFLAAMTLVTASQHIGLLWVTIEATTLASAPLIYFQRNQASLEATWKYLLLCSVGIALALVGNFLLAGATTSEFGEPVDLLIGDLMQQASRLHVPWVKAAFLFCLVGYGTKMGLAPMHNWKPDAYGESPSAVAALLSGGLVNCAFLGILRMHQICVATGESSFSQELLVGFGLLSMVVGGVFILGQVDFKRLLAYSSVEHMGILALGVGLGGVGTFGSLLHAVNNSFAKGCLFLVAGNILTVYRTRNSREVGGLLRSLPWSGFMWLAGALAITGTPPFGLFMSEFTILKSALDQSRYGVAAIYLAALGMVFMGMTAVVLQMTQGTSQLTHAGQRHVWEPLWSILPPAVLCGLVLMLGLYIPPRLSALLHEAAHSLGGL